MDRTPLIFALYCLFAAGVIACIGWYSWWVFQTPHSVDGRKHPSNVDTRTAAAKALSTEADTADDLLAESVARNPNQIVFAIKDSEITDKGVQSLLALKHLLKLQIEECDNVTDNGVKQLAALPQLGGLSLNSCHQVTSESLTWLSHLPLAYLDLTDTRVDDSGMQAISQMMTLQVLFLDQTEVTDKGLAYLRALPLIQLYLRRLDHITPSACDSLSQMHHLQLIDLTGDNHIGAGVEKLSRLHLTSLSLKRTDIKDEDLRALPAMKSLTSLDLSFTGVTDKVVPVLEKLKTLKQLSLIDCPQVSPASVERLRRALPKTVVQFGLTQHVKHMMEVKDQFK